PDKVGVVVPANVPLKVGLVGGWPAKSKAKPLAAAKWSVLFVVFTVTCTLPPVAAVMAVAMAHSRWGGGAVATVSGVPRPGAGVGGLVTEMSGLRACTGKAVVVVDSGTDVPPTGRVLSATVSGPASPRPVACTPSICWASAPASVFNWLL